MHVLNKRNNRSRLSGIAVFMILMLSLTLTVPNIMWANAHSGDGISSGGQNGTVNKDGDNIEILTHEGETCNNVVYAEDLTKKETKQLENEAELEPLVKEEGSNIYQADLTDKEEKALEKEDGVIVEDNMDFDASAVKIDKNAKKVKNNQNDEENNGASEEEGVWIQQDTADKISEKINADWNRDMINADGEKDSTPAADAVKVAVMDSGVDYISDANIKETVNLVENEQGCADMLIDMTGHGTSVATIINSIAPEAEIYSVRVLDKDNKGTLSRVVAGIYWCIENDVDIINMSFGTQGRSEILSKAINEAKEKGILIIASAGNDQEAGVEYPAKYDDVVAVGSVDPDGEAAENSARGPEVELTAPGEEILAQSMLGMYTEVNGTSVAAPHVTAAAAKLWEKDRTKSDEFIRGLMEASSNKTLTEEKDDAGIIDLEYAEDIYDRFEENHVKKVPENKTEVTTYEDGEVDARWGNGSNSTTKLHQVLVDKGKEYLKADENKNLSLNDNQMKALKNGSIYPDSGQGNLSHEYAHGRRCTNWIASYIYLTAMAKKMKNSTDTFTAPTGNEVFGKGTFTSMISLMKADITFSKIKYKGSLQAWDYHSHILKDCGYASSSNSAKAILRSLFIYGIALHDLTDTFAHATYTIDKKKIVHPKYYKEHIKTMSNILNGADTKTVCERRWTDAVYASKELIRHVIDGKQGQIADFYPNDYRKWKTRQTKGSRNYLLHRVAEKAYAINNSNFYMDTAFYNVDYRSFVKKENKHDNDDEPNED